MNENNNFRIGTSSQRHSVSVNHAYKEPVSPDNGQFRDLQNGQYFRQTTNKNNSNAEENDVQSSVDYSTSNKEKNNATIIFILIIALIIIVAIIYSLSS